MGLDFALDPGLMLVGPAFMCIYLYLSSVSCDDENALGSACRMNDSNYARTLRDLLQAKGIRPSNSQLTSTPAIETTYSRGRRPCRSRKEARRQGGSLARCGIIEMRRSRNDIKLPARIMPPYLIDYQFSGAFLRYSPRTRRGGDPS